VFSGVEMAAFIACGLLYGIVAVPEHRAARARAERRPYDWEREDAGLNRE